MITRYSHQFITGTDTGVGKTIVTGVLATEAAKAGQRVVVFKPIQTGSAELSLADDLLTLAKHFYAAGVSYHGPFQLASSLSGPPHRAAPTDRFNSCVGAVPCGGPPGSIVTVESLTVMPGTVTLANTYNFYPPVAPVVADVNGIIDIDLLVAQVDRLKTIADVVLVEGAGGVMVPLTPAADTIILMKQLGLPVILAARPDLGTINHTRLSVQALQNAGLNLHQVIISDTLTIVRIPQYRPCLLNWRNGSQRTFQSDICRIRR